MNENRGYFLGETTMNHVLTTRDVVQELVKNAMEIANTRIMHCPDWGVSCGLRTVGEQKTRFSIGRDMYDRVLYEGLVQTYCDGVKILSSHQSGLAIDIFAICPITGKADYTASSLALVYSCFAEAAMKMGITIKWGGNFTTLDDGTHIEVIL